MTVRWLTVTAGDVPDGDGWLTAGERAAQAGLVVPKRRGDWRLGRWAAKGALGAHLGLAGERVEIRAEEDGGLVALLAGKPAPVTVSISHRAGRAVAATAASGVALGCDLELVEPRSGAFVREWLAPEEQAWVATDPDLRVNLVWTAKEAAAKALREGLRLDVRRAVVGVSAAPPGLDGWAPLGVDCRGQGARFAGWWRRLDGFVLTVVTAPPTPPPLRHPVSLAAERRGSPRRE